MDIVKRLRIPVDSQDDWIIGTNKLMNEAANEIERLRAALANERERCAKICDSLAADAWGFTEDQAAYEKAAEAVREAK